MLIKFNFHIFFYFVFFRGKRAAWRWARDRAAVASRWSWLLAQISDLEYRIRQHNELYNQIRRSKGLVTFEDSVNPTQTSTKQSVNGFRGILPGNTKPLDVDIPPNGAIDPGTLNGSSRTRPFQRNGFRKRKLLQTVNLHTISKKAARPRYVVYIYIKYYVYSIFYFIKI